MLMPTRRHEPRHPDPTPEEIAAKCAEIQRGWTEKQRLRHLAYSPAEEWTVPEVVVVECEPDTSDFWFWAI